MTTVHVALTDLGMKRLDHNGHGISEIIDPDDIAIEPSGALRFEWRHISDGNQKETLVYAAGTWACYAAIYDS